MAWYVESARDWLEALGPGDPPTDMFHPDVTIQNVSEWITPGVYAGHEGIRRWWRDLSEPLSDPKFEVLEAVDLGEGLGMGWHRLTGTFRETGLRFDGSWASTWRAQDGLIVAIVGYLTREEALASVRREDPAA